MIKAACYAMNFPEQDSVWMSGTESGRYNFSACNSVPSIREGPGMVGLGGSLSLLDLLGWFTILDRSTALAAVAIVSEH